VPNFANIGHLSEEVRTRLVFPLLDFAGSDAIGSEIALDAQASNSTTLATALRVNPFTGVGVEMGAADLFKPSRPDPRICSPGGSSRIVTGRLFPNPGVHKLNKFSSFIL